MTVLTPPEDVRLEIKFAAYDVHIYTILNWIALHSAAFRVPHPDRRINNVYFDTHGYAGYIQNLSGASSRVKVRYRWYGDSREPAPGGLEVKCKRNYLGWKRRFHTPHLQVNPEHDWRTIRSLLIGQLSAEGRTWLETYPVPVLINRYSRKYFVSGDDKVRVTIDSGQAVWDQRFKAMPNYRRRAALPATLVAEFKFDRKDRDLASELIQTMPIRVSRHSKYMNGVRAIAGV